MRLRLFTSESSLGWGECRGQVNYHSWTTKDSFKNTQRIPFEIYNIIKYFNRKYFFNYHSQKTVVRARDFSFQYWVLAHPMWSWKKYFLLKYLIILYISKGILSVFLNEALVVHKWKFTWLWHSTQPIELSLMNNLSLI